MSVSRADQYSTRSSEDSLAELSKKLTDDLRRNVRSLSFQEIFAPEWMNIADYLDRIAQITDMEKDLPQKNKDETLWESEQLALKYVLEEGKLNLCVRLMDNYLEYVDNCDPSTLTDTQVDKCRKFSGGISKILANAWKHKEALQTTDLPLMVDVLSRQLYTLGFSSTSEGSSDTSNDDKLKSFTTTTMSSLNSLGTHLERIGEDRAIKEIQRRKTIENFFSTLWRRKDLSNVDLINATEGVGLIINSEDFQSNKKDTLQGISSRPCGEIETVADDVLQCEKVHFSSLVKQPGVKRRIRPVLDFAMLARRVSSKK